ncbi:MAG: hypothetical protein HFH91_09390 [Lachnospiraceae bacterium]|nr:hypothetical protein [Lachnospiraceae bacterium]
MRVSICVGEYAKAPYHIPGLEMNVFSMEELCYCMKENAFLLDLSLLNDGLLNWIERECGLRELARALHPLVHKKGVLSTFVVTILRYVGLYDEACVEETEQALKKGAGLSGIEKRKRQADYLVEKKKYQSAAKGYEELLRQWREMEKEGTGIPAADCLASLWHNKGVAYIGLMHYERAAECFLQAYELEGGDDYLTDYLGAMRMMLSEEDYVAFVAGHEEWHACTLKLEKKLEAAMGEWERQPEYLRLYNRRELRSFDRQAYDEEGERLTQALKDAYRM